MKSLRWNHKEGSAVMSTEDAQAYVDSKGWDYHIENDEIVVRICPLCSDAKSRFSINRRMGLWQCFKCGERGNVLTLKRHCGDIEPPSAVAEAWGDDISYDVVSPEELQLNAIQLSNDISAKQWLYARMLGEDAISAFRLGVAYKEEGRFLTLPYFSDGVCVNIKYRSLPPAEKAFQIKAKHEKPLFNRDALKAPGLKSVIVVEGEIDCISGVMMGYPNMVSLPQGADNFSPEHWDDLIGFERVYFILDPDAAGRAGVKKISTRLGEERCYDVRIPNGMDINELLVKFGYEDAKKKLDACISEAKQCGKGEVASVMTALTELENHITSFGSVETGYASPWASVNHVIGMISPGEVMLLQAIPKTGKTTLAQQWLAWLAQVHRVPTMMYCLEMPLWRLAQSLVAGATLSSRSDITSLEVKMTKLKFREVPFFYGAVPKEWTFEHIKEVIVYSAKRHGVKLVCFDNLQLLCRSVENTFQEQAHVSRGFKELAMDLDIAILLVVQPRKMDPRSSPGMYDPSGSGSIIADADGMLSLWRKPSHSSDETITEEDIVTEERESFSPEVLIRCPASRYRAGGQAVLYFDGDRATFTEMDESHALAPVRIRSEESS